MKLARALLGPLLVAIATAPAVARAAPPSPPPPSQSDVEAARAHYKRGVQLYEAGSYEAALIELERANQLAPTYKLLYNLALVQMRLGDFAGALRSFSSYLEAGGSEVAPARRAEVERSLSDLGARVAIVEITTDVSGAQVAIDELAVGTTPLAAAIRVNPGPHRVLATKDGFSPVTKSIDLAGGEHAAVSLTLAKPAPEPPPPVVTPPPVQSEVSPLPPPPIPLPPPKPAAPAGPPTWIGWTATGVLAAGAIGTGVAALSESRKLSDEVNGGPTSAATIHSTRQTTVTLALASDILTGAAIAAGAATLYWTLTTTKRDGAPASSHAELRLGPAGVAVVGSF